MKRSLKRPLAILAASAMLFGLASCGSSSSSDTEAAVETEAAAETVAAETAAAETVAAETAAAETAAAGAAPSAAGEGITLAVNPWTGSAVNAAVAKAVLDAAGTPVTIKDIDENATWPGMDSGEIDAVLEVWPSGHAKDKATYIEEKKSVVDLGPLGPEAKIGWYVPTAVVEANPSLATWEGFKDVALAKQFATAESGDLGQFLMGDPSYVSYDEQIIKNLGLPLKYTVAGSEAALVTAINQAVADNKPLLLQFWKPHWLQSKVALTEVKLPDYTPECAASAEAKDGKYACDYPVDILYKAASAKLEAKNAAAFAFLSKFQLTTAQQQEIAAMVDSDGKTAAEAATAWVAANPDVVKSWF